MASQQQQPPQRALAAAAAPLGGHRLQQQQQQQPWWAGPLGGIGAALQGVQHNLQQLADSLPKPPPQQPRSGAAADGHARGAAASVSVSSRTAAGVPAAPGGMGAGAAAAAAAAGGTSSAVTLSQPRPSASSHQAQQPVTKDDLGRASWVFLHTLAAQFPEHPTRQQQRDARQLMDSFARVYPCADCAAHFQEIVKRDPPDVSSGPAFARWMCGAHNAVNRRLNKPVFNCDLVAARWAPLDCDEHNSCALTVGRPPR